MQYRSSSINVINRLFWCSSHLVEKYKYLGKILLSYLSTIRELFLLRDWGVEKNGKSKGNLCGTGTAVHYA